MKQRILITGANGFIGKSLIELLDKSKFEIISKNSKELDITNLDKLSDFFEENKNIDFVIHTATVGGRWNDPNTPRVFYENTKMFENLILFKNNYKLMIMFGSGAELIDPFPLNYYGLAKKYVTEKIKKENLPVINLRLWGCFGKYEKIDRFIKANITRYKNKEPMIIHQDKYMDYFYINDLNKIVDDILKNYNLTLKKEINLTYPDTYKLSQITAYINTLSEYRVEVKIEKPELAQSYCNLVHDYVLERGLWKGIKEMYDEL